MNEQRAFTPSPEQLNQWREEFCTAFNIRLWELTPSCNFSSVGLAREWNGYIRARTEQATKALDDRGIADLVNQLTATAKEFGCHGSARQRISGLVLAALGGQAAEIAALKVQIAELMPLAKFGAKILKTKALFDVDAETFAFSLGLIEWRGSSLADPTIKPNIEATLEQLLKDTP